MVGEKKVENLQPTKAILPYVCLLYYPLNLAPLGFAIGMLEC